VPLPEQSEQNREHAALRYVRRGILAMAGYVPGEQRNDVIKLNTNESPMPPSPRVRALLHELADEQLRLYPDPLAGPLCRAAAERFACHTDQVLAGNGSDDCLTILFRTHLERGDGVAAPWPTYGLYDTLAAIQGVEMRHVDYRDTGPDGSWALPDALSRVDARLVLVANPNNPSGTLTPVDELRRLADRLDGVLVVDEAYIDFAEPGSSLLPHLDAHDNLVVLRSFSKSFGLAGARLGLLFAAAPLIAQYRKVKDSYNLDALSQAIGVAALEDRDHHDRLVQEVCSGRAELERAFADFGWTWPTSQANFLLCEVGERAEAIKNALSERGVLVRWWKNDALRTRLRISVGSREQNRRLIVALREILR